MRHALLVPTQSREVTRFGNPGHAVPGNLAERLFDLGLGIDHVYVLQNAVTVRRPGGWDEASRAAVTAVVEGFLLFY